MEKKHTAEIAVTYDVALVSIINLKCSIDMISELFNAIAGQNINIDLINQTPPYREIINLSFSIAASDIVKSIETLNRFKQKVPSLMVEIDADNAKITIKDEQMKNQPGVAARIFSVLAANDIAIKLISTSETDISLLVYMKDVDRAVSTLKAEYNIYS